MMSRLRSGAVGLAVWVLAIAVPAGQSQTPNVTHTVAVEGTVVDAGLIALPGVHVTLESSSAKPMTQVSDANGHFLFAAVIPGPYHVRAELSETTTLVRDVVVRSAPDSQRLPIVLSSVRSNTGQTVRPVSMQGAPATSSTVSLTGVVVDSTGGVIPGATVVVKSPAGVSTTVVSNNSGSFVCPLLAPGLYEVTVSLSGFKSVKFTSVTVAAGRVTNLHVTLEIGAMAEVKQVVATTDVVDTASTMVAATIGADQINNLPVVTKNALNFVTFLPGVNSGSTQSQRSSTILGLPQSTIATTIDGVNVQDQGLRPSDNLFATRYRQQTDLIEEVTVPGTFAGTEAYQHSAPNRFEVARRSPLSTFGADVDTASFSNVRRFLGAGQLPPADAVRVEELVNYFRFPYAEPRADRPIGLTTEVGPCPWAPTHKLVLIGARAKAQSNNDVGSRNLVLLIDVSGSMESPDRLPLIKTALGLFVDTLREDDRVAIVTYAGTSGLALPSTEVRNRTRIHDVINSLRADGSTNGGEGLIMAYRTAIEHYVPGGVNRVILATDGDFNVGITSRQDLLHLIDRQKTSGVFLSVLGVGSGNLKDATMEMLADHGNGNYAYLDSLREAQRVLVREGAATLETVAKDVKFQVEFNPATVAAWRLVGYEDRRMSAQAFNDDTKDGGEMGAGHTVTVLYEIVPVGADPSPTSGDRPAVDPLRYQTPGPSVPARPAASDAAATHPDEWMTVKVRYKLPSADTSELMTQSVRTATTPTPNLALASAVAEFGLLLRDSQTTSLDRWAALSKRVSALDGARLGAGDRESLKEMVDLAAGLAKLRR
jgi:Ca-activated chloride channel family protein